MNKKHVNYPKGWWEKSALKVEKMAQMWREKPSWHDERVKEREERKRKANNEKKQKNDQQYLNLISFRFFNIS